jgi:hypothetical protein
MRLKRSVYMGMAAAILVFLWMLAGIESLVVKVFVSFAVLGAVFFAASKS